MKIVLACIHRPVCAGRHMARAFRRIGVDLRTVGWSTGKDTNWGVDALDAWLPDGDFENHWPDWTPDLVLYMDTEFNPWHYAAYADVPHVNYCTTNNVVNMTMPGMAHYFVAQRNSKVWPFRNHDMTWLPNAHDPTIHTPSPIPYAEREFDVCLVGRLDEDRNRILDAMEAAGLKVFRATGLVGKAYAAAYHNSRISLCTGVADGTAMRLFETAAMGNLVLSGPVADDGQLDFPGYIILPNVAPDRFVDIAQWYLDRPDDAQAMIAHAAQWVAPHTWDARARAIVEWFETWRDKDFTDMTATPPMFEGSLDAVLRDIAQAFDFDGDVLVPYAYEDPWTGWDYGDGMFPVGSIFREEGQVLYALVRALNPSSVLELGTAAGASATHLAAALTANGSGKLTCIDAGLHPGALIPESLQGVVRIVSGEAVSYLEKRRRVDFIFEDADHRPETVAAVAVLAAEKLSPGGLLISHDAMHPAIGANIRQGYADAGLTDVRHYRIEPGDCGLAIWRKGE